MILIMYLIAMLFIFLIFRFIFFGLQFTLLVYYFIVFFEDIKDLDNHYLLKLMDAIYMCLEQQLLYTKNVISIV